MAFLFLVHKLLGKGKNKKMETSQLESMIHNYTATLMNFIPSLVGALLVLVIGLWIIKQLEKGITKYFERKDFDVSLESFLKSLTTTGLKLFLIVSVAGMVGFPTSSLLAILGAAGLAVGLALQGSLSNFAGGVLVLIFKPYKVGDLVTLMDKFGEVREIQIFNTIIVTPDNKTVILPNGAVSNGVIINHSKQGRLLVDLRVKVDFGADVDKVKRIILDTLNADPKVLKDPAATVNVIDYAEGAVVLCVRPQATVANYWDVYFNSLENIQKALNANGIEGPRVVRHILDK